MASSADHWVPLFASAERAETSFQPNIFVPGVNTPFGSYFFLALTNACQTSGPKCSTHSDCGMIIEYGRAVGIGIEQYGYTAIGARLAAASRSGIAWLHKIAKRFRN